MRAFVFIFTRSASKRKLAGTINRGVQSNYIAFNRSVASGNKIADYVQARSSALQNLPAGIKVSIPPTQQLGAVSASYGALIIWAYIQGATEPFAAQQSDLASLQLALGSIGGIYYLQRQKGVGLWRACLYGLAGLSAGVAVGALIEQWARVDIVPILGLGSPGVFQAEFGLLGLAAATICLA